MFRLTEDEIKEALAAELDENFFKERNIPRYSKEMFVSRAQVKKLLLGISKETKKLDQTTYLVPDYTKFKEALEEVGL